MPALAGLRHGAWGSALALAAAAVVLAAGPRTARAHDTWFERIDAAPGQPLQLALGTGTHFPRYEEPVLLKYVEHRACTDERAHEHKPELARVGRRHTVLSVPGLVTAAFSCVARLQPFEIELTPALVDIYFEEIRAGDALRTIAAKQRAQGRAFEERYLKVARIEGASASPRAGMQPLDVLRVAPDGELKAGVDAVFEVQRDGKPLPGLPVQLLNDALPAGLWARTDAAGRIKLRLPLPGRWLLRGVDLRPPASDVARWESRFISYTFEAAR